LQQFSCYDKIKRTIATIWVRHGHSHISCLIALKCVLFQTLQNKFQKNRVNAMVENNHCELNKCTFARLEVYKALDQSLSKKNIKSGFKAIGIQPLNPKAMDEKTKPSEVYMIIITIYILDKTKTILIE
jgi:hypothetical protein